MSEIKKGALVKVWNDDVNEYAIGVVTQVFSDTYIVDIFGSGETDFDNAIEIPAELAAQLDALGRIGDD
jgi:hypothetical protein